MVQQGTACRYPALLAVSILENPNQNNIDCHSSDLCKSLPLHNIAIAFPMKLFPSNCITAKCFCLSFVWSGVRHGAYCSGHYLFTMINVRKQRAANTIPKLGFP